MFVLRPAWWLGVLSIALSTPASAQTRVSFDQALALSRARAPAITVARAMENVAEAESRTGALYPNPSFTAGTSTQTAKLSVGATLPLLLLGQRGAALDAGRAELSVVQLETQVSLADVRAATARAFVALWLAEHTASERADAAIISHKLESAVAGRVELGSSPEVEGLRAHAESLRAEMDARSAATLVEASSAELCAWIGGRFDQSLRVSGDPSIPAHIPALEELWPRVAENPNILRAAAEARASDARATSERAQVRPLLTLDFGADLADRTLPATNYRAQLGFEVPLFNQRGPFIEREERRAVAARSQVKAELVRSSSALIVAYRTFAALSEQAQTLAEGVVPAAAAAARASEESYAFGRAALVSVLDAERARIDAELLLIESRSARANAWIDVERALGLP